MNAGIWLNVASGILLAAVGGIVLAIRPRRRENVVFAVFAIAYGLRPVPANLAYQAGILREPNIVFAAILGLVAAAMMLVVVMRFPRGMGPGERRIHRVGALAGVSVLAVTGISYLYAYRNGTFVDSPAGYVQVATFVVLHASTAAALVILPLRFRLAPLEDGIARRQLALMAAALTSYFAFVATGGWSDDASLFRFLLTGGSFGVALKLFEIAFTLFTVTLWLRNTATLVCAAAARNVAIYGAAVLLAGLIYATQDRLSGGHGAARIATVLIFAVAIARFQLLDVDVKLRWGLRGGTIAAIFLAVFFVVSEGAQEIIAQRTNSSLIGIGVTGLLVFAIAPIQRVADRLANAAIPAPFEGAQGAANAADAYRNQVTIAWRDGTLNPKEMLMLRELRGYLQISAEEAERIEKEIAVAAGAS